MKSPVYLFFAACACGAVAGLVTLTIGLVSKNTSLSRIGGWIVIAAFVIAWLPVLAVRIHTVIEKSRRK